MTKSAELAKNTIILFVGKFCTQFVSFLLLPLYTAILSTSEYGVVDLIQTYISLLIPLATLRIDTSVFRYIIDSREDVSEKKNIISNSLFTLLVLNMIFLVCIIVISKFFTISYIELLIINVLVTSISNVLLQMARGLGDNIGYSIASSATAILTIILNVIFLLIFKMGAISLLVSSAIANVVCSLIIIIKDKVIKFVDIRRINKGTLSELLKYAIPMVPTGLSWWIVNTSDRTIISAVIGTSANGIYAIANKFPTVFTNIYSIFSLSWAESASLHINDNDKNEFFTKTLNTVFNMFSSICLGIIAFLPIVFNWFVNDKYNEAYLYIPILLIANMFNIVQGFAAGIYIAKKMSKKCATSSMLSALINIVVNIIFIKKFGLYAAAVSTLIAYLVVAIYRYIDVQKYVIMKFYKTTIIYNIAMFIISLITYYVGNLYMNIINIIIVCLYAVLLNKNMIYSTIDAIRLKIRKESKKSNNEI